MKIGTKVVMRNCAEAEKYKDKVWTTTSESWECCGSTIVKLGGKSGGFDVSCLKVVQEPGEWPTECKYCHCADANGKCMELNPSDGTPPCDGMDYLEFKASREEDR